MKSGVYFKTFYELPPIQLPNQVVTQRHNVDDSLNDLKSDFKKNKLVAGLVWRNSGSEQVPRSRDKY